MSELHYMPLLNVEYFKSLNSLVTYIGDIMAEDKSINF